MNREQIEAWLALEGWEFIQFNHYVPMFRCGRRLVYLSNSAVVRYRASQPHEAGMDFSFADCTYTDEQLQLIYQEIIKHEN